MVPDRGTERQRGGIENLSWEDMAVGDSVTLEVEESRTRNIPLQVVGRYPLPGEPGRREVIFAIGHTDATFVDGYGRPVAVPPGSLCIGGECGDFSGPGSTEYAAGIRRGTGFSLENVVTPEGEVIGEVVVREVSFIGLSKHPPTDASELGDEVDGYRAIIDPYRELEEHVEPPDELADIPY